MPLEISDIFSVFVKVDATEAFHEGEVLEWLRREE